jgi:membrane dipeptidase
MQRRDFVRLAGAAALGPVAASLACAGRRPGTWARYDDAVVIDALASPIQFNIPQQTLPLTESVLEHVRASGLTAVNLTVNVRATDDASAFANTRARIDAWKREIDAHLDVLTLARSLGDIHDAKTAGRLGIILGFQDTVPFEDDLAGLDDFHGMGVRIVQLTYNVRNRIGSGSLVPEDTGLTDLGREAVARMDELGIVVDLSHCGARTTLDGIRASTNPVGITHSGCRAVFDHPRSKDDETLRAMADGGGVLGIYLMPFLNPSGPPAAEDVLVHIEHALDVCGEDHVGIGSDQGIVPLDVSGDFPQRFAEVSAERSELGIAAPREDTIPFVPELNHPRRLETIAGLMESRGHSGRVIEKVMGANFMRLFEEVWG